VALATMMTLVGLTAVLLGILAKLAIAAYQPVRQVWFVRRRKRCALLNAQGLRE
jgi:hypothetical protein